MEQPIEIHRIGINSDFDIYVDTPLDDTIGAVEECAVWTGGATPVGDYAKVGKREGGVLTVDDYNAATPSDTLTVYSDTAHLGQLRVCVRRADLLTGRVWLRVVFADAAGMRTAVTRPTDIMLVSHGADDDGKYPNAYAHPQWAEHDRAWLDRLKDAEYQRGVAYGRALTADEARAEGFAEGNAQGLRQGDADGYARGLAEGTAQGKEQGFMEGQQAVISEFNAGKAAVAEAMRSRGMDVADNASYAELAQGIEAHTFDHAGFLREIGWEDADTAQFDAEVEYSKRLQKSYDSVVSPKIFQSKTALVFAPKVDTSGVTDFASFFSGCSRLVAVPPLDTANGTNFYGMFNGCGALMQLPPLDTANGTNFEFMFQACGSLTQLPPLDVSHGTNFVGMFTRCGVLTDIELSGFGTAPTVSPIGSMFTSCPNISHDSLIKSFLTYSYDRAAAGYAAVTIPLGATLLAKLTDEEKAAITAKGYTLT